MKRKRHTPEEIIKKLREAAGLIAGGKTAEEAARQIGVSVPTYHRWKEPHGGAEKSTVKRLKELEKENLRLKLRWQANQANQTYYNAERTMRYDDAVSLVADNQRHAETLLRLQKPDAKRPLCKVI